MGKSKVRRWVFNGNVTSSRFDKNHVHSAFKLIYLYHWSVQNHALYIDYPKKQ